jgi:hypothetical protein
MGAVGGFDHIERQSEFEIWIGGYEIEFGQ